MIELLDPTAEREPGERTPAPRPESLEGLTIGLLDIAKVRGDVFLDRIAEILDERGFRVARFRKSTYTKPAPADLRGEIRTRCHALIEGLADWGSCASCSVHDLTEFEAAGIPSVLAASSEFEGAVQAQGSALGFKPAVVYVPHPIQDRTDAELRVLADRAVDRLLAGLIADGIASPPQR